MKRKALLTLALALLSTAAIAAEDNREVRSKEDDARAAQQAQDQGARMNDANDSNARAALLNDLGTSNLPGAKRAAAIFTRQSNTDLPAANVEAMEQAVLARKAASPGMSSIDALQAELADRNSGVDRFDDDCAGK